MPPPPGPRRTSSARSGEPEGRSWPEEGRADGRRGPGEEARWWTWPPPSTGNLGKPSTGRERSLCARRARRSPFWSRNRRSERQSRDQNGREGDATAGRRPLPALGTTCYILATELSTVVACSPGTRYGGGRRLGITVSDGAPPPCVAAVDFQTSPEQYRHWRLSVDGPVATLTMAGRSRGRSAGRLRAQAQLLRPGRRHRAGRRRPAPPLRAPRGPRRRAHRRRREGVLRRGEHPDAGRVVAPPQGQLLQVHQRDPQRHRGRHGALRPGLDRGRQRHRGGRRLRAGAGLRRDHPHRRPGLRRLAAGGPAAGRPARHGWAHTGGRQAPRPPGPGRRLRHPHRGQQGPPGRRVGAGRRAGAPLPLRRGRAGARDRPRRPLRPAHRRPRRPPRPDRVAAGRRPPAGRARRGGHRPRARRRHHHRPRPGGSAAAGRRGARRRRRLVLAARGVPGAGRGDPATSASTSRRSAPGC